MQFRPNPVHRQRCQNCRFQHLWADARKTSAVSVTHRVGSCQHRIGSANLHHGPPSTHAWSSGRMWFPRCRSSCCSNEGRDPLRKLNLSDHLPRLSGRVYWPLSRWNHAWIGPWALKSVLCQRCSATNWRAFQHPPGSQSDSELTGSCKSWFERTSAWAAFVYFFWI